MKYSPLDSFSVLFTHAMPVGSVAQAMVEDALSYHQKQEGAGSEGASAPPEEVMVADNAVIYRLCQPQVGLNLCVYKYEFAAWYCVL